MNNVKNYMNFYVDNLRIIKVMTETETKFNFSFYRPPSTFGYIRVNDHVARSEGITDFPLLMKNLVQRGCYNIDPQNAP